MKQKNYRKPIKQKKFLQKVSKVLVAFSILSVTLTTVFLRNDICCIMKAYGENLDTAYQRIDVITRPTINDSIQFYTDSIISIKTELIAEINKYMSLNSRRPKMSAEYIVSVCEDKNFDICLLLSQAQLESSFGARMSGNSCFGVISRKYKNTDDAIDDYVRIMQTYYIIDRTPEELIKSNFRMETNKKAKYAGNPAYGSLIMGIRNGLIKKTKIHDLFQDLISMNRELALLRDKNNNLMQMLAMRTN